MKVSLFFRWFDCWIGAFWNNNKGTLYICPIPMFGIKIKFQDRDRN